MKSLVGLMLYFHLDNSQKKYYETQLSYVDTKLTQESSKPQINSEL